MAAEPLVPPLPETPPPRPAPGIDGAGDPRRCLLHDASDWGVIEAAGADAGSFLHGQLSSDVKSLAPGAGQWTSYNTPKGRMLANGWLWRAPSGDGFAFALAGDLAEPVRKRLAMFVLRAKVTLKDATAERVRLGLSGPLAASAAATVLDAPPPPARALERGSIRAVALPDGRFLLFVPPGAAASVRERLLAHATASSQASWRLAGIRAGIPLVTAATADLFVPQTANWDIVGGVDFRKGCYTGQEVIARTQYLGRLKERCHRFATAAAAPEPASRLFAATFGDQPCGSVVNAAPSPDGGSEMLAVVQLAAVEAGELRLGSTDGPVLSELPLPYAIPGSASPPARAR